MTRTITEHSSKRWYQPTIGIALIAAVLIPLTIWELTVNNKPVVAFMTWTGLFLGHVLSRGRFGFTGPIKKMTQQGEARQARALIYLFMITTTIAGAAVMGFGIKSFSYPANMPLGWGVIIGGFIFGTGMMLATGCASGTLSDVGDGIVPAVVVLIFFMLGSTIGVNFYGSKLDNSFLPKGANTSLFEVTHSVALGLIINLLLLSVVLAGITLFQKWREANDKVIVTPMDDEYLKITDGQMTDAKTFKEFFSYKTWAKIFSPRFSWITVVFLLSLWYAVNVLAFKQTPGITGAYAHWGIQLTHGLGSQKALDWNNGWNMMNDSQSWQNIGIIVGALSAKLFSNTFKFIDWKGQKWYNWALFALGGLLMGLGARLARGCNFGALFTGVTFGTGFGWVFTIFLLLGAIPTAYLAKRIHHYTPGYVYKGK